MIHATSAPLENPQPTPHSTCATTSRGNVVTNPVMIMPAARNAWPATSGHLRLTASDQTPVGMSDASSVTDSTVPSTSSCHAERCAVITKYSPETST